MIALALCTAALATAALSSFGSQACDVCGVDSAGKAHTFDLSSLPNATRSYKLDGIGPPKWPHTRKACWSSSKRSSRSVWKQTHLSEQTVFHHDEEKTLFMCQDRLARDNQPQRNAEIKTADVCFLFQQAVSGGS